MAVREENISEEVIRYLVTMRTCAPSADNCQPSRPLYPFIMHRYVNRKPYRRQEIAHDVVQKLRHVVAETPGADMLWMDEKHVKNEMKKIIFDADRILFEDQRLHHGLFRWLRTGKEDAAKTDGMNMDVLELNFFQRKVFPVLSNWTVLSWLNKIGVSRMIASNSLMLLKRSPAYCLLTMEERSATAYINGGMMMERFWIKANALGLSLQPMAGFIFLLNHLSHDGAVQFSKNHRASIQNMYKEIEKILREQKNRVPTMFFRIGYATRPMARTPRRPVDEIFRSVRLGDS
jgi:hypothetical protein